MTVAATSERIAHHGPASHHTSPVPIRAGDTAINDIAGCCRTTSRAARARWGS